MPKVSVCVVCYNQEKYIYQCLQTIVDQKIDFDIEIIVADDCSTDRTRDIIRKFEKKYPKLFRIFLHEKNIGPYRNFKFVHDQAIGEYVAHIDGDDYALPGKLQTQVDLLDNDKNCNLVWTSILIETSPGNLHEQNRFFIKNALSKVYKKSDLIKYGAIGSNSSKMYRRQIENKFIDLPKFELIDYFVNVVNVGDGVARFAGEKPLGVYRLGVGIASSGNKTKNLTLQSIEYLSEVFPMYRLECNVAVGIRLLGDVRRKGFPIAKSLRLFIKTFHWCVFFSIFYNLSFIRCLTLEVKK